MPEAGAPLRVLAMSHDPSSAISRIRLGDSLGRLQAAGQIQQRFRLFDDWGHADLAWCDVLVLQRPLGAAQQRLMSLSHQRGVPVLVELDDLLFEPAAHLMHRPQLLAARPRLLAMLAAAQRIAVSTAPLAGAVAAALADAATPGLAPVPIDCVPNTATAWPGRPARHDDQAVVTLWLSGSDVQQLGALGDALQTLQADAQRAGRWRLCAVGPIADALAPLGIPHQRLGLLPPGGFLDTLAASSNPVGLIPLDDSAFSRCKSAVKFFDLALAGIPCLCAERPPYADVVRNGHTGWLCGDTPADWTPALRTLIDSAAQRQAMADAARQAVMAHHPPGGSDALWLASLRGAAGAAPGVRRPLRVAERMADLLHAPVRRLQALNRTRLARRRQGR